MKIVVGVGNVLQKDDGIGIHLVRRLSKMFSNAGGIEFIDAGTSNEIFFCAKEADSILIIDAVRNNGIPGDVYRFSWEKWKLFLIGSKGRSTISLHQEGIYDALVLAEISGILPRKIEIIGIEPCEIGWGEELSLELRLKYEDIENYLKRILEDMSPIIQAEDRAQFN